MFEDSIVTNLPVIKGKEKVVCYFEEGKIVCKNVGAFLDQSIDYFIAAKVYYDDKATDPTNFGGIDIKSIVYDVKG